ncbi:MAG: hypothetical protein GF309_03605 [Candidatus Lokiarchaeota archaeon]|nr:hypothetical protein [Candidatus Lokiarchaeota archaeon]
MGRYWLLAVLCILVTLSLGPTIPESNRSVVQESVASFRKSDLSIHAPIYLDGNDDFAEAGFPGEGTAADPYRISDLLIESNGICIEIRNSDVYFRIENCGFNSPSGDELGVAVKLVNVRNSELVLLQIENKENGLVIYNSENCLLSNLSIADVGENGLYITGCESIACEFVEVQNCGRSGLVFHRSSSITAYECTISDSDSDSIRIDSVADVLISDSIMQDSIKTGISCYNAANSSILNCEINRTGMAGIEFDQCSTMLTSEVTIEDARGGVSCLRSSPVNIKSSTIRHSGGVALYAHSSPMLSISGVTVTNVDEGIMIVGASDSSRVTSCHVESVDVDAFYLSDCTNCTFSDSYIQDSAEDGIEILRSSNFTLSNNTILWSVDWLGYDGIRIDNCSDGLLTGNHIRQSASHSIDVYRNSVGIDIVSNLIQSSLGHGIRLDDATGCSILANLVDGSFCSAVHIAQSTDIRMAWNRLNMSGEPNLFTKSSSDIEVALNAFINATVSHFESESCTDIQFHNGTQGNYYDSYTGNDTNGDLLGDSPYYLDGGFEDPHPLMTMTMLEEVWAKEFDIPDSNGAESPANRLLSDSVIEFLLFLAPAIQILAVSIILIELRRRR